MLDLAAQMDCGCQDRDKAISRIAWSNIYSKACHACIMSGLDEPVQDLHHVQVTRIWMRSTSYDRPCT